MKRTIIALGLLAAVGAAPGARADAIPPPEELSDIQKTLIGVWRQDKCDYPEGLGHACIQRTIAFGNDSFSELGFSGMSIANMFGSGVAQGNWTATQPDATHINVTVKRDDGQAQELQITIESETTIVVRDSAYTRYPEARFTREAGPVLKGD